jgi:hypothetical protein
MKSVMSNQAMVLARPQSHATRTPRKPPWKAHAAFPDGEDFQRVGEVVGRFVEKHLAQPAADDDAEHAVEQQVVELLGVMKPGRVRIR